MFSAFSNCPPHGWGPEFLQRNSKILLWIFFEEGPGPCSIASRLFLDCFSFVSAFPAFHISNSLNLPFGIQGRSRSLNGAYFLQTRNGRQKESVLRRDPLGLAQFHLGILMESILFHCFLYLCDSVTLLSGGFFFFFFFKEEAVSYVWASQIAQW